MIVLAVDTSSDCGSVAIVRDGQLTGEVRLASSVQHSERLFRSIEFLLESSQVKIGDVDLFVAARGPGSFTGLRIGLAAVESLAFATGGQARAMSTLTALAWKVGPSRSLIAPVFDARRGEVHGALYRRRGGDLEELRPPRTEAPQAFLASLPSEPVLLCGPGTPLCAPDCLLESWEVNNRDAYLATAIADMAAAGHEEPFEPLYLRPPAVQPASGGKGG